MYGKLLIFWFSLQVVNTKDSFTISQAKNFSNSSMCTEKNLCGIKSTESLKNLHKSTFLTLNGTISFEPNHKNHKQHIASNLIIGSLSEPSCPGLEDADNLTQTQLINRLTAPCRYDRLERPNYLLDELNGNSEIVDIFARTFIYALQNVASSDLQLKMHGLLQLRYIDPRLAFGQYSTNRTQPILGDAQLRELIWVPHLFFSNEQDATILGTNEKDILVSISADGTVVISSRIKAILYCWMDLIKFPFDEQHCTTLLQSWMYNSTELILNWEKDLPINFDPKLQLSEYKLVHAWCNESTTSFDENNMHYGVFSGSYSSLNFTVYIVRESGYYVMGYFLPSIIIVAISWVSFWLQADQTSARTTLNTSTMLSFITLSISQDNNLPKVSYIKLSEIWFIGCILFIFSSLVEFALVNAIWRRNQSLELKKINSKHILKSTLALRADRSNNASSSNSLEANDEMRQNQTLPTMTSQEITIWIDRKSRFAFPLAFLIFNVIFWLIVYFL